MPWKQFGYNLLPFLILHLSSRSGQTVQAGMGFGVGLLLICSTILYLSLSFVNSVPLFLNRIDNLKNTTTYPKEQ